MKRNRCGVDEAADTTRVRIEHVTSIIRSRCPTRVEELQIIAQQRDGSKMASLLMAQFLTVAGLDWSPRPPIYDIAGAIWSLRGVEGG